MCKAENSRLKHTASMSINEPAAIWLNDEIKVGVSVSSTGRFQLQGQQALSAILLWQSYINAFGRRIKSLSGNFEIELQDGRKFAGSFEAKLRKPSKVDLCL
jgi:ABC-type branched-subunit amino acid transport system substrate-binding protein